MKVNYKKFLNFIFIIIYLISIISIYYQNSNLFPPHMDENEFVTLIYDWANDNNDFSLVDYNSAFAIHHGILLKNFIPMIHYKIFQDNLLFSTRIMGFVLISTIFLGIYISFKKLNESKIFLSTFLIFWSIFLYTYIGFKRLSVNAETQIDAFALAFLLIALLPSLYINKKMWFHALFGLILGIGFSLSYYVIAIIIPIALYQLISFFLKEDVIKSIKLISVEIGGFILGIIPWIILGIKTNFSNLSYRGLNMILISNETFIEKMYRVMFRNEVITTLPVFLSFIIYASLFYNIYLVFRDLNKKNKSYSTIIREHSTISFVVFLIFASISTVVNSSDAIIPYEYFMIIIPFSIYLISTTIIEIVNVKKLFNKKIRLKNFLGNTVVYILVFIVIISILGSTTFKSTEKQDPKLLITPEGKYFNIGHYKRMYNTQEEVLQDCLNINNSVAKKHCLYGLIIHDVTSLNKKSLNEINKLDNKTREWIYSQIVYWFYWNDILNVWQSDLEDYYIFNKINVSNKEKLKNVFEIRGICGRLYEFETNLDKIFNSTNMNISQKDECYVGICMDKIYNTGMNQIRDIKFTNSELRTQLDKYKEPCNKALEMYEDEFLEFYDIDISTIFGEKS
jgi:hypothetical protein